MPSNLHNPHIAEFTVDLRPAGSSQNDKLGNSFFIFTLLLAFFLHLAGLYAWWLSPKTQIIEIPVRALSVKLGGEDLSPQVESRPNPNAENNKAVENTLSKLVRDEEDKSKQPKPAVKKAEKTLVPAPLKPTQAVKAAGESAPKQYIRNNPEHVLKVPPGATEVGGEKASRQIAERYEQLISAWIQKFKQYPEEARRQNMQGETLVRIRIDRQGNIHYWALEYSTGAPLLDRSAIEMVKRANPVPAVPSDYPEGEQFDFLIPVNFKLE